MVYTKYMPSRSLRHASRNKRELQAAREIGFDIQVVSSDRPDKFASCYPEYQLISDRVHKLNNRMPRLKRYWFIILNYIKSTAAIRRVKTDVISCHDIDSLCRGWISTWFKKEKPKLIYDSHEFEIGRNKKRNKLQLWWIAHLERFLIKRCAFSIMVNDAIADEVQRIHKLKQRPIVVRSTPNMWTVDSAVCAERRKELLSAMEAPTDMLLMYHGGVMSGRGIEMLLSVVQKNPAVCAVILGSGEERYIQGLKKQAETLGVSGRVVFYPAVSIEVLWQYVGAADVGMVTIPAVAKSYYYMLPNKFFENIQSETPVICSDFPAVAPLVEKYKIGLTCDPTDLDAINSCVERMRTDKSFYAQCKENLKLAKQDLCWEKEKMVLLEALRELSDER